MQPVKMVVFLLLLTVTMLLQGCGSGSGAGSSTNGTLALSDLTVAAQSSGTYSVSGTATYTPPAGKAPNGAQINVSISVPNGKPSSQSNTFTLGTDGIATFSYIVTQGTVAADVAVTATISDLSATKRGTIPAAP